MTELKNISDAIMSLNENDLLYVALYGNKNFDSNININILTATIKFIKDSEGFDQLLFLSIIKTYPFIQTIFKLLAQEVCCITTRTFVLISYTLKLLFRNEH